MDCKGSVMHVLREQRAAAGAFQVFTGPHYRGMINSKAGEMNNKLNFFGVYYQLREKKFDLELQQKIKLKAGREQVSATLDWNCAAYTPLHCNHHQLPSGHGESL